ALDAVRAVDPACGSGAYLLGLLHEIVDLYRLLYSDKLKTDARELHRIKLDIIQNSLYGADIDPFATNIAMLRLWLSLTVDSDRPEALPNLDFKIETGDSVTGPNPGDMPDLMRVNLDEKARQLAIIKGKYMRARGDEKRSLRGLVLQEQREIAFKLRSLAPGSIDWRVQFCEIFFSDRGGFDIVLANPPYIRQELIKDQKPRLKEVFGPLFSGTADLYVFFYLRGLQLLAPGGMLAYISSNKWFRAGYGEKLRAHIAKTTTVQTILDFHDLPVFEAIAYPMIFTAKKQPPTDTHTATLAEPPDLEPPYPDVKEVVAKYGHQMPKTALGRDGTWNLMSADAQTHHANTVGKGIRIADYVGQHIHYGVKSGLSEAFIITTAERAALIRADKRSAEIIKRVAFGRDIRKWVIDQRDRWIIFSRRGIDIERYPAIKQHFSTFKKRLMPRPRSYDAAANGPWKGRKPGSYAWYEIQDEVDYFAEFDKPKIVYQKFQVKPAFAFVSDGTFVNDSAYIIASDDKFLLAILNSRPFWNEIARTCSFLQGGYQLMRSYFENARIPDASAADRSVIGALAQKCLDARGVDCAAWEQEIDARVAALYGL
ncbi:MAG: Eco57I restriction-modification methylase domain-containing protein, partial [Tepidisphaeraceae bacterium]